MNFSAAVAKFLVESNINNNKKCMTTATLASINRGNNRSAIAADSWLIDPTYSEVSFVVICYFLPFVCLFGITLNSLSIWVFTSGNRLCQSSLKEYLVALCTFDIVQLFLSLALLPTQTLEQRLRRVGGAMESIYLQLTLVLTYILPFLTPILLSANCASIWTMTAITVQRFRAICVPFSLGEYRYIRKAKLMILLVTLLSVLVNVPQFLIHQWVWDPCQNLTVLNHTAWSRTKAFNVVRGFLFLSMMYSLPFLILCVLNSRILWAIYDNKKSGKELIFKQCHEHERRAALMIGAVVLTFFVCHTLGIYTILLIVIEPEVSKAGYEYWLVNDFNNLLININSSINPCIYMVFTKRFRDLFWEKMRPRWPKQVWSDSLLLSSNCAAFRLRSMSGLSKGGGGERMSVISQSHKTFNERQSSHNTLLSKRSG